MRFLLKALFRIFERLSSRLEEKRMPDPIDPPSLPVLDIDRSLRLPDDQYVKEETKKDLICGSSYLSKYW